MSGFASFAAACEAIRQERSKPGKIRCLAEYLKAVPSSDRSGVTAWFAGRTLGPSGGPLSMVGATLLRKAVCLASGRSEAEFKQTFLKHSDAGEAAAELIGRRGALHARGLPLASVIRAFERLAAARSPEVVRGLLVEVLGGCGPEEVRILVKLLHRNLRIGLNEGLVEEAVVAAFGAEADPLPIRPSEPLPSPSRSTGKTSSADQQLRFLE